MFTRRELETKAKRELQQIAREVGADSPGDQRKRSEWIDAILAAQGRETVQGPEIKFQEFKPTKVANPIPVITFTQVYPRREPKQ